MSFAAVAAAASLLASCGGQVGTTAQQEPTMNLVMTVPAGGQVGQLSGADHFKIYENGYGQTKIVGEDRVGNRVSESLMTRYSDSTTDATTSLRLESVYPGKGAVEVKTDGTILENSLKAEDFLFSGASSNSYVNDAANGVPYNSCGFLQAACIGGGVALFFSAVYGVYGFLPRYLAGLGIDSIVAQLQRAVNMGPGRGLGTFLVTLANSWDQICRARDRACGYVGCCWPQDGPGCYWAPCNSVGHCRGCK